MNFFVGKRDVAGRNLMGLAATGTAAYLLTLFSDNKYYLQGSTTTYLQSVSADASISQILVTGECAGGVQSIYKNSSLIPSTPLATGLINQINSVGRYASFYTNGYLQTEIFYNSNQSTNRAGMQALIRSYYGI